MKLSIQIASRHFSLSEAIESNLREKASKLERFCDRITGCRVVVEIPHRRHHHGKLYNIRLNITLPGTELVVNRQPNEDIHVAIGEAFDAAGRQLEEYVRRRRGEEKTHEDAGKFGDVHQLKFQMGGDTGPPSGGKRAACGMDQTDGPARIGGPGDAGFRPGGDRR